ncbi:glycosyltransferase family 4 protein [Novosphingobium album (ex Liu et al. 2023)]|uniref:Glycosyltransferase family 4 protein n=1 Tax=Novosphingobium album (ex Liu et al. 2023) TaxID=3031130 RepID=A0ABT5WQF1_9SPHN|nr:glycosyltransferase family 4 protein [Novosphingobium album (ex Liu et al. 2023)]MDE8652280.1 glycosyltransferase family 4 protein [Novosphingobium album (ex Liu et al. 2023)]
MSPDTMASAGPKRILCVHQGGELYGSDRSFLQIVEAIREGWPDARIRVILAVDGPLRMLLEKVANEVTVQDLCVLRLANAVSTLFKGTIGLPYYLMAAKREINRADLVYINTTVIADYMIAARLPPHKSVIHVREIPKAKAMLVVQRLVRFSRAKIIYNSQATADAFALPVDQIQTVIHNGVAPIDRPAQPEIPAVFTPERPLKLAMLGRISDWKGQNLLIEGVAALLPEDQKRVSVRIVGSTFLNVQGPVDALQRQIDKAGLSRNVSLEPFKDDPAEVYLWSDVCVVPSRLPEPFGRVAIEAMSHARPVIAAAHGGLLEIVRDAKTGWLFKPNDAALLAEAIRQALACPTRLRAMALTALHDFEQRFSSNIMTERVCDFLGRVMET